MEIELSTGDVLKFDKLPTENVQFVQFRLEERVLGDIPQATIILRCDEDLIERLDEVVVTLTDTTGYSIEGSMYVYDLKYYNNIYTIKLLGCKPEFTREVHTTSFDSINDALDAILMEENLSDIESDINQDAKIYQMNETNYKLCTRLLKSWKKDTVFGYCLDGVRMIDLTQYTTNDDYKDVFCSNGNDKVVKDASLSSPKYAEEEVEFIDYSEDAETPDPNHVYVKFDKMFVPVNTEYKDLIGNFIHNKRLDTMASEVTYHRRDFIPLNLCEGVKIEGNTSDSVSTFDTEDMYLAARVITASPQSIEVDYTFRSLHP